MKYITIEKLERKLRGRLKIVEFQENPLYPNQSLQQEVDPDLLEDVVEEQEYFVDLILGQIYVLPLTHEHPILADIVTSLVLSELLKVHFQGQGLSTIGHDLSGRSQDSKNDAYQKLGMLVQGYQVQLPGQFTVMHNANTNEYRRIVLRGETFIKTSPNQIPINNETYVLSMNGEYNEKTNPFGDSPYQRWN